MAGYIADVGVYKGASSLFFAKLIKIFESESLTLCHGFDWFQGRVTSDKDSDFVPDGGYKTEYDEIVELVEQQEMDNILKIHKLDLRCELGAFFDKHPHIRFKLIMMDAGPIRRYESQYSNVL